MLNNEFLCLLHILLLCSFTANGKEKEDLIVGDGQGRIEQTVSNVYVTNASSISSRPIFIVISLDGFRYDYFSKADTPNLNWVKENGVFAPYIKPQFPTKTFPNHHSISTGLHPETHGVIDNKLFDPLYNKTLGVKNETFWVYNPDVVPIWVLNEWGGGVSGVMMYPGSLYAYGHNSTKATYIEDFNMSISFESRVDTIVSWITDETNPANLVMGYFEEPDELGHGFGPESNEVRMSIERVDRVIGYLIKKLKDLSILDHVNLVFFSDHGFANVNQKHIINISSLVNSSRYTFYGGSPSYLLYPKGEEVKTLYSDLKQASIGNNFSVYLKEEINDRQPHWFYSDGRRMSPIVMTADLGFVFDDFYSKILYFEEKFKIAANDTEHVYGTHGYDNHLMPMAAFFRATGPAFRRGGYELEPFDNIDIFPLLCRLLQLQTPPNNGSIPITLFKALSLTSGGTADSSPVVGWIIGGLLIGLCILAFISMAVLRRRRTRGGYHYGNENSINEDEGSTVSYRFAPGVQVEGRFHNVNRNSGDLDCAEEQALLSLSDESLGHQSA